MPIKHEIAHAVYAMLEALTVFGDRRQLTAPIASAADQFNNLLAGARGEFADSILVERIEPLTGDDTVITLLARLAVLKSAIDSALIRLNRGDVLNQGFRYWRHMSGRYYAVEFRRGKLWAACGPIAFVDVDPLVLPHLPFETGEIMQWMERHRREFTVYMPS